MIMLGVKATQKKGLKKKVMKIKATMTIVLRGKAL
jgi:hypothetical protein